jgi:DNA-binding MarR family transcriptional regulator
MDQETFDLSVMEVHLGYWMRRLSNRVSYTFAQALQARQISVAEWVAVGILSRQKGMTPSQLADAAGMTRGAISKVLDKLEAKKWIARATHSEDSRVQLLTLTRLGARLVPELAEIADRNDEHFFGCLSKGEQATLKRLLLKLNEAHHLRGAPVD